MDQAAQKNLNLFKMRAAQHFTRCSQAGHKILKSELTEENLLFSFLLCKATLPSAQFLFCWLIPASGEGHYLLSLVWVLNGRVCIEIHV